MAAKGFVSILLVHLFPVVIALTGILLLELNLVRLFRQVRTSCIRNYWPAQKNAAKLIQSLLSLNPLALQLRIELKAAQLKLLEAIESAIPIAIAAAEAVIAEIEAQRQLLDLEQKSILAAIAANKEIYDDTIYVNVKQLWNSSALTISARPVSPHSDPIEPDISDIAPVYKPSSNFSADQTMERKWLITWRMPEILHKYLQGSGKWEVGCAVTLKSQKENFAVTLHEARF